MMKMRAFPLLFISMFFCLLNVRNRRHRMAPLLSIPVITPLQTRLPCYPRLPAQKHTKPFYTDLIYMFLFQVALPSIPSHHTLPL